MLVGSRSCSHSDPSLLRKHMQVRKRNMLLHVLRELPGHASFPVQLAKAMDARLRTWLMPMYGYSEEEELGTLSSTELEGMSLCTPAATATIQPASLLLLLATTQSYLMPRRPSLHVQLCWPAAWRKNCCRSTARA